MKLLNTLVLAATLALVALTAWAHQGDSTQVLAHEEKSKKADVAYSYTAQTGDSYTKIARKAVQTYGLKNKVNLSPAGIVFAETNLTITGGSPEINLGQRLEMKESVIHEWVDKAQKLTDAQKAAWNYYVQFVDFNTNNVGQSG